MWNTGMASSFCSQFPICCSTGLLEAMRVEQNEKKKSPSLGFTSHADAETTHTHWFQKSGGDIYSTTISLVWMYTWIRTWNLNLCFASITSEADISRSGLRRKWAATSLTKTSLSNAIRARNQIQVQARQPRSLGAARLFSTCWHRSDCHTGI